MHYSVHHLDLDSCNPVLDSTQASQMNTKNGLAQGFALFATGQTALAANSAVNGLQ